MAHKHILEVIINSRSSQNAYMYSRACLSFLKDIQLYFDHVHLINGKFDLDSFAKMMI